MRIYVVSADKTSLFLYEAEQVPRKGEVFVVNLFDNDDDCNDCDDDGRPARELRPLTRTTFEVLSVTWDVTRHYDAPSWSDTASSVTIEVAERDVLDRQILAGMA